MAFLYALSLFLCEIGSKAAHMPQTAPSDNRVRGRHLPSSVWSSAVYWRPPAPAGIMFSLSLLPAAPCTVYCVLYTVYCILCTVCRVLYTVYCILCTVYCIPCTVYCVLYAVYCILCTVYRVPYTVYCIPCTVYCMQWHCPPFHLA